jgi:hypothetical protein
LRDIATPIIDQYGRLTAEHKQVTRNLGVCDWDDQLDIGVFLVIDSVSVIEKSGKKGLARKMIHELVQKVP